MDSNAKDLKKELKIEINQAIITQTKWIIGSAGIMIAFFKLIDKFF